MASKRDIGLVSSDITIPIEFMLTRYLKRLNMEESSIRKRWFPCYWTTILWMTYLAQNHLCRLVNTVSITSKRSQAESEQSDCSQTSSNEDKENSMPIIPMSSLCLHWRMSDYSPTAQIPLATFYRLWIQYLQGDINGFVPITRTRAHACVATGCARPPNGGADRVLQATRNSHHCTRAAAAVVARREGEVALRRLAQSGMAVLVSKKTPALGAEHKERKIFSRQFAGSKLEHTVPYTVTFLRCTHARERSGRQASSGCEGKVGRISEIGPKCATNFEHIEVHSKTEKKQKQIEAPIVIVTMARAIINSLEHVVYVWPDRRTMALNDIYVWPDFFTTSLTRYYK
ncbi:hypothetical protein G5I_11876 [Acromyrmex echinatior]|uniref:Uncharacterized protein n=1 Tax=Acromyrmex echinatior TaxID=103372 RepID=F4X0S9_ACREC|nr:hypothetical protein G5I_11876 [Acromyrmex echinatior]